MTEVIEKTEYKKGYKKTKLGWIPEDWDIVHLDSICDVRDGTHDSPKYYNYGIPFLTSKNLTENGLDFYNVNYISEEDHKNFSERSKVENGDILFGMIGTIGNPTIVNTTINFSIKNMALIKFFKDTKINNFYLLNTIKSKIISNQFSKTANEGVQSFISLRKIRKLLIPLPLKEEQEKIAEILSAWDDGIETLEKLIEVKKHYLKNIAKKLLSNKTKSSEWSEFSLGSISINLNKKVCEKKLPVLSITAGTGFVLQSDKFGKNIAGNQYKNYTLLRKNEFSYNKGNSKKYAQGCVYCLKNYEEAAVPNVFISFKLNNEIALNEYFEQLFKYNYHGSKLKKYINSGVRDDGLLNLNSNNFFKIKFKIPQIEEQQKIVDVLNSYDREIELLNLKLEKLKEQKKGLMQKLLTGQIRVKV